jgi:hypothetical protein
MRSGMFDSSGPSGEARPCLGNRAQISVGQQLESEFYRKAPQAKEGFHAPLLLM